MPERTSAFLRTLIYFTLLAMASYWFVDVWLAAVVPASLTILQSLLLNGIVVLAGGLAGRSLLRRWPEGPRETSPSAAKSQVFDQAVADICEQALTVGDLNDVVELAANKLARGLGTPYSVVFELSPDGRQIEPRAAAGWRAQDLGRAPLSGRAASLEAAGLRAEAPMVRQAGAIWEDSLYARLLGEHTIHSAIMAPVRADGQSYGLVGVYSRREHAFGRDEADFVGRVAATLGRIAARERALQASRFQAHLLGAVGQAIIATDPEGRITYWNRAAEALYGWTAQEVFGKNVVEVTPAEEVQAEAAAIMEKLRRGHTWEGEFNVRRRDGTPFTAWVKETPVLDEGGRLQAIIGVSTDISRLRRAEEALRASEELHRVVLSSISDAVFLTKPDGKLSYICPNVDVIFGYNVQEVEAMGTIESLLGEGLFDPEELEKSGELANIEMDVASKSGVRRGLLVNVKQLDFQGGSVLYTCRDVTLRRKSREQLRQYAERLRALLEIHNAILLARSPRQVAETALRHLRRIVACQRASVLLFDLGARTARVLAADADAFTDLRTERQFSLEDLGGWSQILRGEPSMVSDLLAEATRTPVEDELIREGVASYIGLPLRVSGEIIGAVFVGFDQVRAFGEDEASVVREVATSMGLAIQNSRLLEAERRRRAELETLREGNLRLTSSLELAPVLEAICEQALSLVPGDDAHIFLYEGGKLDFGAARYAGSTQGRAYSEPRPEGITYTVARKAEPVIIGNTKGHPLYATDYQDWEGAIVSMPLLSRGHVIGVLNLAFDQPHAFSEDELRVLRLLGDQAAIAITNARLFASQRRHQAELETLLDVSQVLAGRLEMQSVLRAIAEAIVNLLPGAEASSVFLHSAEDDRLHAKAWHGHPDEAMAGLSLPADMSLAGAVFTGSGPKLFADVRAEPTFVDPGIPQLDRVQSVAGVPITVGEKPIGVVLADNLTRTDAFDEDDLRLLQSLAAQAAAAIERARLFEQVRAGRERLADLSKRLVDVQEDERRHLARELHDEVGQMLTVLKLTLEMGQRSGTAEAADLLEEALELVQMLLAQVREMSLALRPSMLDDLGLVPAIHWLLERIGDRAGVQFELVHINMDRRFDSAIETAAYRVVQESLTNVVRHAKAQQGIVRLWSDARVLQIEISDDGKGFVPERFLADPSRSGLSGMRERVLLLGGRFEIRSALGQGTSITVELPQEERLERRMDPDRWA